MKKISIGLVSFTDPRKTAFEKEREIVIRQKHEKLRQEIEGWGFNVVDVNNSFSNEVFGINSKELALEAGKILTYNDVCCIIVGLWHWTESNLVTTMLRVTKDIPLMLYCDDDPEWAGATCIASVGASLWETYLVNKKPNHYRLIGNNEILRKWINSMSVVYRLRRSSILIFGSPYTLGMEHLMDDLPELKKIVDDIIMLDQYLIISRAEEIIQKEHSKIDEFLNSLNDVKIIFDERMLTKVNLEKQIALYLAAKEIVDQIGNVAIVSVKCQPELSERYGVTGCFIPAFLNGTTCEGDLKGTISSLILQFLSGNPSLFGDVKYVSNDYVFIANCGASSIFYAKLAKKMDENLRNITIQAQCQGAGGGAITYRTPQSDFTILRITRINKRYFAQYFYTESVNFGREMEEKLKWGKVWPHTAIRNPLNNQNLFISVVGANHLSLTIGNFKTEIRYVINELGIKGVDFNDNSEVRRFVEDIYGNNIW